MITLELDTVLEVLEDAEREALARGMKTRALVFAEIRKTYDRPLDKNWPRWAMPVASCAAVASLVAWSLFMASL